MGRFDPSFDKKTGLFTLNNWWWEEGVEVDQAMVNTLIGCLLDFLSYLGARDVEFSKTLLRVADLDWLKEI